MKPLNRERLLLAAGLVLGLLGGLAYAWLINPVSYYRTTPACLTAAHRHSYIQLAASAFAATGDLERAAVRLQELDLPDPAAAVLEAAGQMDPASPGQQALRQLSDALGAGSAPLETPAAYYSPSGTIPTADPEVQQPAIQQAGLELSVDEIRRVCSAEEDPSMLRVFVNDQENKGVPGVQLEIRWGDGCSRMYTGLKTGPGEGYADFLMQEDVGYSLWAEGLPVTADPLQVPDCFTLDGQRYPGSWVVELRLYSTQRSR